MLAYLPCMGSHGCNPYMYACCYTFLCLMFLEAGVCASVEKFLWSAVATVDQDSWCLACPSVHVGSKLAFSPCGHMLKLWLWLPCRVLQIWLCSQEWQQSLSSRHVPFTAASSLRGGMSCLFVSTVCQSVDSFGSDAVRNARIQLATNMQG